MTILYLHGLESKLNTQKRELLEKYGTVFAPNLSYKTNEDMIQTLFTMLQYKEFDIIIGSSIGGFSGFYLAQMFGKKALVFNPALAQRSVIQNIPQSIPQRFKQNIHIVLGKCDTVVPATETLDFLARHYQDETNITVEKIPLLAHQIPLDIFTAVTERYFSSA